MAVNSDWSAVVRIQDLTRSWEVTTAKELLAALKTRDESGANAFWLAHGGHLWPHLVILVNAIGTALHYFPADGHAGFSPSHETTGVTPSFVKFAISPYRADDLTIRADDLVEWKDAVAAAKEFLRSPGLPGCIACEEL